MFQVHPLAHVARALMDCEQRETSEASLWLSSDPSPPVIIIAVIIARHYYHHHHHLILYY